MRFRDFIVKDFRTLNGFILSKCGKKPEVGKEDNYG